MSTDLNQAHFTSATVEPAHFDRTLFVTVREWLPIRERVFGYGTKRLPCQAHHRGETRDAWTTQSWQHSEWSIEYNELEQMNLVGWLRSADHDNKRSARMHGLLDTENRLGGHYSRV